MTHKYSFLSGRLRQLDMNQGDVAERLGICPAAVSDRFRGRTSWTLYEAYEVLDLIGAKPDELPIYFPREGKNLAF